MKTAQVTETKDLAYKNGYIKCACGWKKELGNGFNGYHIANCPSCTSELETRNQRKVTTGKHPNLTVTIGKHVYFVLSNGIHLQYKKQVWSVHRGLTTRHANNL